METREGGDSDTETQVGERLRDIETWEKLTKIFRGRDLEIQRLSKRNHQQINKLNGRIYLKTTV